MLLDKISNIELAVHNKNYPEKDLFEIYKRFQKDQDYRKKNKLKIRPLDKEFIDSMMRGIPSCSGVAVGFDRIHMIAEGKKSLDELSVFSV